jgi:hypothetical protein
MTRSRLGLLELAKELGNISRACRLMGYSRSSYYRFRHIYDRQGAAALDDIGRRKKVTKAPAVAPSDTYVCEFPIGPAGNEVYAADALAFVFVALVSLPHQHHADDQLIDVLAADALSDGAHPGLNHVLLHSVSTSDHGLDAPTTIAPHSDYFLA